MTDDHVTLREFIERIINEHEKQMEQRFKAQEDAVKMATSILDRRLEGMNEFRAQLTKQADHFHTKESHETFKEAVDKDIRELRESRARTEGRASTAVIAAIVGTIISLASFIIHVLK